jgi:MFS family permease
MPLLQIYPQFECFNSTTQVFEKCSRDTACQAGNWRLDWTSEKTLNNWITDMDLYCSEKWMIGLLGSIYYQGNLLGSILLSNLPDIYGRKI